MVDNFGGMLIDRPERVGFNPDEAMVLIQYRNLKDQYNRYLDVFKSFDEAMEKIEIHGAVNTTAFARLQKLMRESKTITDFVQKIAIEYSPSIDAKLEALEGIAVETKNTSNRSLFTPESEQKILKQIKK